MAAMQTASPEFLGFGGPRMVLDLATAVWEGFSGVLELGLGRMEQARAVARVASGRRTLEAVLLGHKYEPSTADKYARIVLGFLREANRVPWAGLSNEDVRAYLAGLRLAGAGNATIRLHLCALRAVFDRILGLGLTEGIAHVRRPPPRQPATEEEVLLMLAACRSPRELEVVDLLYVGKLMPRDLRLFFPSPGRSEPITTRTLRRTVVRVRGRCGLQDITCTAIRKAPVGSLQIAA
jgi:hypothetical protein